MFRQIEVIERQGAGIAERARHEEELDRFALLGDQDVDPDTIKIAFFARDVASPVFTPVDLRALDAVIVTNRNRITVNHVG